MPVFPVFVVMLLFACIRIITGMLNCFLPVLRMTRVYIAGRYIHISSTLLYMMSGYPYRTGKGRRRNHYMNNSRSFGNDYTRLRRAGTE